MSDIHNKKDVPVQRRANLHEKAVQAVAAGEVQSTPRRPRRAPSAAPAPVSTDVHTHIQVDPEVLEAAKRIISRPKSPYTRYEIVDAETVIVR